MTFAYRPAGHTRPDDFHRGHRSPPRSQVAQPVLRWLQGPSERGPDDELIDEVAVTGANTPDRDAVAGLLGEHTTVAASGHADTETAATAHDTPAGADDDDVAAAAPDTVTGGDTTATVDTTRVPSVDAPASTDEPHEHDEDGLNVDALVTELSSTHGELVTQERGSRRRCRGRYAVTVTDRTGDRSEATLGPRSP